MSAINFGLIGAGTVGCGVVRIIQDSAGVIENRTGVGLRIKKIADIDPDRIRPVDIPKSLFTKDAYEIINDPSIDIIVELIGGTTIAREFILAAIKQGKHVVTANKALLAHAGAEIFQAAAENGVDVGFEASVGGGIPIIRAIQEGYVANRITSIRGIINGTSNYILSKMTEEGGNFADVLVQAQAVGYAEADPSFDIDGIDAAHKLSILMMLSFGAFFNFSDIRVEGIRHITPLDIAFADEFGYRIKLLAVAKARGGGIEAAVRPTLIQKGNPLADVSGAFNAIHIGGDAVGPTMLYGMGAGMMPTASAVLSDVVHIAKNAALKNVHSSVPRLYSAGSPLPLIPMSEITGKYYLRFQLEDRPGVLGQVAGTLGRNNISIESVMQKTRHENGGDVPVVIMTHEAREVDISNALREIEYANRGGKTLLLRIEEL
ncbi:MAG: homoserine dehydrogenase [Deltaproteobacteria bacterium]